MIYLSDKNIAVIGVDTGYGNVKTANTITPTGITAYDTEPIFAGNTIEYNGKYYRVGEGHKEFIVDKADDEENMMTEISRVFSHRAVHDVSQQQGVEHAQTAADRLNQRQNQNISLFSSGDPPQPPRRTIHIPPYSSKKATGQR